LATNTDHDQRPADQAVRALIDKLRKIVDPDRVLTRHQDLLVYSYDASFLTRLKPCPPDVVVQPLTTAEVSAVVSAAAELGVPVVPRGAGTAQTGGPVPARGGLVIDLSRMNRILETDLDNLQVIVEPGVIHAVLNAALEAKGFFFPPDPGSSQMCTIGGMVAGNTSGMRAVKYGATAEYVLGLEVVLADGSVVTTGGLRCRALKNVSGYDLTRLFVGSEGTLGVITKIRLKVIPVPERRGVVMAAFETIGAAGETVVDVFRARLRPAAVEIMDRTACRAAMLHVPGLVLPQGDAVLFFQVDGPPPAVTYEAEKLAAVCRRRASHVEWAEDPARVNALWQARSVVGAASGRVREEATRVCAGEDICVPIDRVAEALTAVQEISRRHGFPILTYGHIGDGNLHAAPLIDMRDLAEVERAHRAVDEIHRLALSMNGTTTAEHGVGLVRAGYMDEEHGPALGIMRAIKKALDPHGVLNPGKMALEPEAGR
jgi:glycolate oxidase